MSKAEELKQEIAALLSSIDNVWILDQIKQFTINMVKEGGE